MGVQIANTASYTKRSVSPTGIFMGYCLGNFVGPLIFKEVDAPRHEPGFIAVVITSVIAGVLSIVYRFVCIWESKKRDRDGSEAFEHAYEDDLTDKKAFEPLSHQSGILFNRKQNSQFWLTPPLNTCDHLETISGPRHISISIAKIKGARALGLAGSDDKVSWLKNELGFDDALNYKDPNFFKSFRAATKDLIDVFFDNDRALSRAKPHARFVMCGGISQYNSKVQQGPKNYLMIVSMRIRMAGFTVFDYEKEYPKALKEMAQWLEEGKLKRKEHIVTGGLKQAEKALLDLYKGVNTGKLLVEVVEGFVMMILSG